VVDPDALSGDDLDTDQRLAGLRVDDDAADLALLGPQRLDGDRGRRRSQESGTTHHGFSTGKGAESAETAQEHTWIQ
jgi:hypothetical protein